MDSLLEVDRSALAMDTNVARSDTAIATLVGPVKYILPHVSHLQTNDVYKAYITYKQQPQELAILSSLKEVTVTLMK